MKTAVLTFCFLTGFSLALMVVHHWQMPTPAHAMTFDERAGKMFDEIKPSNKGDRLPQATPDLRGGALIGGNSVRALIFRPSPDTGAPAH
jgi:hypothetical protein